MQATTAAQRADAFMQEWQSSEEAMQQRCAGQVRLTEPAGPLVLAVNLSAVPVAAAYDHLHGATDEVIKAYKGLRVTFTIAKVLFPGWGTVGGDADAGVKRGGKRGGGGGGEPKEKAAAMQGDKVRLYSYELVSIKGKYMRGARSESFAVVEPGMTLSMTIWGNKFESVFKDSGFADIQPFEMMAVELGLKSEMAKAAASGMMLDVKSVRVLRDVTPACPRVVRSGALPQSRAEAELWRERQGENPAEAPAGQQQPWIRGNLSTGVLGMSVSPTPAHGVFAMSESGAVTFYVSQPLADVGCRMVEVRYDRRAFGVATAGGKPVRGSDEWVAKFLNLACMLGGVELLYSYDTYRNGGLNADEVVLDGFVRVDAAAIAKHVLGTRRVFLEDGGCPHVAKALPKEALRHTVVFANAAAGGGGVDVAVDLRVMSKRGGAAVDDSEHDDTKGCEPTSSLAHMGSAWSRAHYVHFFFNGEAMLSAVACAGGGASDRVKRVMQPAALVFGCDDAVVESAEEEAPEPAEKKVKKKKSGDAAGAELPVEPAAA